MKIKIKKWHWYTVLEVVFNGLKEEKETEIEYGVAFYVPAHKEWMYLYHRTRIEAEDAVRSMVKKISKYAMQSHKAYIIRMGGLPMTRCKHCGYSFQAENGWQDYCSQECAMLHFAGMIIPCGITINDGVNRKLRQAVKYWHEFLADERNFKLVRWGGERAKPPQVGRYEERTYTYTDKKGRTHSRTVRVNVGGEICVRPITAEERAKAVRSRGRGSFGELMIDNQPWRDLPSEHGYISQGWFPHD